MNVFTTRAGSATSPELRKHLTWIFALCITIVQGCAPEPKKEQLCPVVSKNRNALTELRDAWELHQVTVLVRHTDKCTGEAGSCPKHGGLTELGKQQASALGEHIPYLLDDGFLLYSSPVKRTIQSTELMFSRPYEIVTWLKTPLCKKSIQSRINDPGQSDNRVWITHSTCINELLDSRQEKLIPFNAGGEENYGLFIFLRTPGQSNQSPSVIGCMWMSDWTSAAKESTL